MAENGARIHRTDVGKGMPGTISDKTCSSIPLSYSLAAILVLFATWIGNKYEIS